MPSCVGRAPAREAVVGGAVRADSSGLGRYGLRAVTVSDVRFVEWRLGIDFGTSFTVAAWASSAQPAGQVLEIDGSTVIPSLVFANADGMLAC